jgi:hypothetical protein
METTTSNTTSTDESEHTRRFVRVPTNIRKNKGGGVSFRIKEVDRWTTPLPDYVESWLSENLSAAGTGLHQSLFPAALYLKPYRSPQDIIEILTARAIELGRPEREARIEVEKTVQRASSLSPVDSPVKSDKLKTDLDRIRAIVAASNMQASDWLDLSPINFDCDDDQTAETVIDLLFPGNPFLCCATELYDARTERREEFRGSLHSLGWIVPNVMANKFALTDSGKLSMRAKSGVGSVRYLVLDFDWSILARDKKTETIYAPLIRDWQRQGITPHDAMTRVIQYLDLEAAFGGLLMVVDTRGKSLHAWFDAIDWTDEQREDFRREAIRHGADPATFTPNQLVRLPGGTRKNNGEQQSVLYFSPQSIRSHTLATERENKKT